MEGWVIGFIIGGVIVLVVVVLLVTLIVLARRIGGRAEAILAALEAARDNTAGLSALTETNLHASRIASGAAVARETVEKGGAR